MTDRVDVVIVGSGSAGSVLAHRLSADPATSVLVLEAGRPDHLWDLAVHMPAALGVPVGSRFHDWRYVSEPEPFMNGRRMAHPRGKVVGGSSSINAMVFQRGHPLDYDRWGADAGMSGWDYAHCLPYFKRLESSAIGASGDVRGYSGPQPLERGPVGNRLFSTLFAAAEQAGHALSPDLNGVDPEGFAPWERTIRDGRRISAARSFLHPALARPNLELRTGALVTKILFNGTRATGVRYVGRSGTTEVVTAGRVVLAGGAFNSPQLLQLSGVGNAAELGALGVPVVHDLPGVGQDLQDHLVAKIQHRCLEPISMDGMRDKRRWPGMGLQWLLRHTGPGATNVFEGGGFVRSTPEQPYPDMMLGFAPLAMAFDDDMPEHGYQLIMAGMRAEARGSVRIRSTDPTAAPALLFNFLSTPADRRFWVDAVRLTREVFDQPAFRDLDGGETFPGPDVETDEQIVDWVRRTGETDMHPSSTCRLGTDDRAVVDPTTMGVRGLDGLHVVDASVMPYCPNSATHGPTMMLAEKGADLILGDTPLPAEYPQRPGVAPAAVPHA